MLLAPDANGFDGNAIVGTAAAGGGFKVAGPANSVIAALGRSTAGGDRT